MIPIDIDRDHYFTKLFFLSILWWCHIAKNKVFSDVNLGEHVETLRRMIFSHDAGHGDDDEVVLAFLNT